MNQLSLQVVTWSMVATTVSTAVWLALVGDAALLAGAQGASRLATQAEAEASQAVRPVTYHPAVQPRGDARAPVMLAPPAERGRPRS